MLDTKHQPGKPHVIIITPTGISLLIHLRYVEFIHETQKQLFDKGWGFSWQPIASRVAEDGRCQGVWRVRDIPYTHIFFLDADIVPPPDAVVRFLGHDKDVVAGVYPFVAKRFENGENDGWKPEKKWSACIGGNDAESAFWDDLPTELFKADHIGGGIIFAKRKVLEAIGWPYFLTTYSESGIAETEDQFFPRRVKEAGFDIWCDPTIKCHHYQNSIDLLGIFGAE